MFLVSWQAIVIRQAVKGNTKNQLSRARRPAKRTFRFAHAVSSTNYSPQDVGQTWPGGLDRAIEPLFGM
jgi:hypothetical protein